MFKRPHFCAFCVGAALLLAAVVLIVRIDLATSRRHDDPTLRVAQTVVALQNGCTTCHGGVPDTSRLVLHYDHDVDESGGLSPVSMPTPTTDSQAAIDQRLLDLGLRILALPDAGSAGHTRAAEAFLQAYDDTRALDSQSAMADLVVVERHIGAVEEMVRLLEHQASPYRVTSDESDPLEPEPVVLSRVQMTGSPAVAYHPLALVMADSQGWTLVTDYRCVTPTESALAARRRGPPAAAVTFLDSVWYREIAMNAVSLCFGDDSPRAVA